MLRSIILSWLWWVVLFPAILVLASPVILLVALFQNARYSEAVRRLYRRVTDFWANYGLLFIP